MEQLCSQLHPEADKDRTDAGDRLPFAEKRFRPENRNCSHDSCLRVAQTCSQGYRVGSEPFAEFFFFCQFNFDNMRRATKSSSRVRSLTFLSFKETERNVSENCGGGEKAKKKNSFIN